MTVSPSIDLHADKYGCPTDGKTNAARAIRMALADVPPGGQLQMGLYTYRTDPIKIKPNVSIVGWGGGHNIANPVIGTALIPNTHSMKLIECAPATLSQYGPSISKISFMNPEGLPAVTGLSFRDVNSWTVDHCGGKYLTGAWLVAACGSSGSDQAWSSVTRYWTYQCGVGIDLDRVLNFNANMGNIDTGNGIGVRGRNNAQNVNFTQLSIDGSNAGGVPHGIGFDIQATGSHDWHIAQFKTEALALFARLRSPKTGSPTRALSFTQGSISGVQEGTLPPAGGGFDIGLGVEMTDISCTVRFDTMPDANRVKDANPKGYPYTNWEKVGP
jgi:hypothetical protein